MPAVPFIHNTDTAYAPPLLRAASPTSSIGTDYGPDETSFDDARMTDAEFDAHCKLMLQLEQPRREEMIANQDPLVPKTRPGPDETVRYAQVTYLLKQRVKFLQEDALFEQTLLRGSQVEEERQPSSSNIDTIMQSMMSTNLDTSPTPVQPLPSNNIFFSPKPSLDFHLPSPPPNPIFSDPSPRLAEPTSPTIRRSTRKTKTTRRA